MPSPRTVRRAPGLLLRILPAAVGLCVALASAPANARQEYNDAVFRAVAELLDAEGRSLPCDRANNCIMCHESTAGGGIFNQPFFNAVTQRGFLIADLSTMLPAIESIRDDMVDTNADDITDFEHLALLENPNPQAADPETGRTPPQRVGSCSGATYGCGGRISPTPPTRRSTQPALLALGLCIVGAGARRMARRSNAG